MFRFLIYIIFCHCSKSTGPKKLADSAMVYANGTVMINYGTSFQSHCDVETKWFPFDTQQCVLVIGNFDGPANEVAFTFTLLPENSQNFLLKNGFIPMG